MQQNAGAMHMKMSRLLWLLLYLSSNCIGVFAQGSDLDLFYEQIRALDSVLATDVENLMENTIDYYLKKNKSEDEKAKLTEAQRYHKAQQAAIEGIIAYAELSLEGYKLALQRRKPDLAEVYFDSLLRTNNLVRVPPIDEYFELRQKRVQSKM